MLMHSQPDKDVRQYLTDSDQDGRMPTMRGLKNRSRLISLKSIGLGLGIVSCSLSAGCMAPMGGAAAGAGSALGAAGVATPAASPTLWSFLGLSKAQKAACLQQLCANPLLGPAANAMLAPMSVMTGGLFGGLCPPSSAFGQGGSPAQQVASAVAADEASAKERVAAVEYLATVDCHYWPDVEEAIIASLRTDRNECVRYAAAKALITGCCCGKKTIEALQIVVNRSEVDGNPSENSDRVVAAACLALQRCLAVYCESREPEPQELPEPLPNPDGREPATAALASSDGVTQASLANLPGGLPDQIRQNADAAISMMIPQRIRTYYRGELAKKPRDLLIAESFQTLRVATSQKFWLGTSTIPPGSQSLMDIVDKARTVAPSAVKPLTREEIINLERVPAMNMSPDESTYLPPLPEFAPPQAAIPDPLSESAKQPQAVTIPIPKAEPIFLNDPSK